METKLILSDLDETLLHSDKTISDYSARIFEQCRQRGILVGFCTSRGKPNIILFEKKINPDICICNGGASIYQNGTLLHATSFSIEETRALLKTAGTVCGAGCEITVDSEITATGRRSQKKVVIYPAMWVEPHSANTIFVSDAYIKYAKPYAVQKILDNI